MYCMAKTTIEIGGKELTYGSKKDMLKSVAAGILEDAEATMTLRQLYYRFVALNLVENKESQYQYLGKAVKEARLEGIIPWSAIEDRTRGTDAGDHDDTSPRAHFEKRFALFENAAAAYHRPRWEGQEKYVEVWVEKEALAGVFAGVCRDLKVVSFPNRGYTSITMLKEAADRIEEAERDGRDATVLYFGDFDPSGQDIERNIRDKLGHTFGSEVDVRRVALTREQIDERRLPPQPAKRTDSRYETFVENHGDMAVELDALPPEDLREMVRDAVDELFDERHYKNEVLPRQRGERETIRGLVDEKLAGGGSE